MQNQNTFSLPLSCGWLAIHKPSSFKNFFASLLIFASLISITLMPGAECVVVRQEQVELERYQRYPVRDIKVTCVMILILVMCVRAKDCSYKLLCTTNIRYGHVSDSTASCSETGCLFHGRKSHSILNLGSRKQI